MEQTKKRIVILGQAFSKNLGDQAIYEALKMIILERGDYHIEKFPIKSLYFLELKNKYTFKWYMQILALLCFHMPLHFINVSRVIKQSDLVIIGGGQLIMDFSILAPIQFYITCIIARIFKKPLFICAIGAGPVRHKLSKIIYRQSLLLASKLSVRDTSSLQLFKEDLGIDINNVALTADPVLALPLKEQKDNSIKAQKVVGISTLAHEYPKHNVQNGDSTKHAKYIEDLCRLVDMLITKLKVRVVLIPTEAPYDVNVMNAIYDGVENKKDVEETYPESVNDLIDIICTCDSLVGTRMHSMIIALSQHIPVVGLTWDKKINSLFDKIGMQDSLYSIEPIDIDGITKTVSKILENNQQYRENIGNRLVEIQQLSRMNAFLAEELINK
jgi:polysaccharide pyruvyl transferase WcaK-like protein